MPLTLIIEAIKIQSQDDLTGDDVVMIRVGNDYRRIGSFSASDDWFVFREGSIMFDVPDGIRKFECWEFDAVTGDDLVGSVDLPESEVVSEEQWVSNGSASYGIRYSCVNI